MSASQTDVGRTAHAGKTVLVTGAAGMLGSQLLLDVPKGWLVVGTDLIEARAGSPAVGHPGVDLAESDQVAKLLDSFEPGALGGVIHAAAYTAVDRAETDVELCERVNALAPEVLAQACAKRGVPMVLVSTDFVFDGTGTRPYRTDDPADPLGVYGRTKFEGEERAKRAHPKGLSIVRTQWLYGPRGNHFPGTILRLAGDRDALSIVDDQRGSPTSTLELAPALWDVLVTGSLGTFHAACEGITTWYGFARAAVELAGDPSQRACQLSPCTTADYPTPAPRPAYSALDSSALAAVRDRTLLPWREALVAFFEYERQAARSTNDGSESTR